MDIDTSVFNSITYGQYGPEGVHVCLDKLLFTTTSTINAGAFDIKSCSKGYGYVLKHRGIKVWFTTTSNGVTIVSINPAFFDSENALISFLRDIFVDDDFLYGRISRLDNAVTIPIDFEKFFPGMDFGRKRVLESWYENSKVSGRYVGRKNRKYSTNVYNKKIESELAFPCTRIEVNSIPETEEGDFFSINDLSAICYHEPFKSIRLYNIEFIEPTNSSQAIRDRFIEFKIRCLREGHWWTRRCLNKDTNKNFDALYGNFFTRTILDCPTLDEMFQQGIRQFFN